MLSRARAAQAALPLSTARTARSAVALEWYVAAPSKRLCDVYMYIEANSFFAHCTESGSARSLLRNIRERGMCDCRWNGNSVVHGLTANFSDNGPSEMTISRRVRFFEFSVCVCVYVRENNGEARIRISNIARWVF